MIGEAKLESFLEDNPPIESNFTKARNGLTDARRSLNLVTGENGQKAGIALDAYLLLAKLCYACGEYEKSLENFVKAELNTLAEKELTLCVLLNICMEILVLIIILFVFCPLDAV